MKLFISIATYGDKNFKYLNSTIDEYKSYKKYDVTINVNGTTPFVRDGVNFIPHIDPKNTVFFHRQEFVDGRNNYDLFLYVEDDILIKESAIDTFLKYDSELPSDHCLGFLRYEQRPVDAPDDKNIYCIDLWSQVEGYDYITNRHIVFNNQNYVIFKNPHQSCFLLTKEKLNYVIDNSNFLRTNIEHGNGTQPLETAASGIYRSWPFADGVINKVWIKNKEDLQNCLIHHMPNIHCDVPYKVGREFITKISTFDSLMKDLEL